MKIENRLSDRAVLFLISSAIAAFFASVGCWYLAYGGWNIQGRAWHVVGWMAFFCSIGAGAGMVALIALLSKVLEMLKSVHVGRIVRQIIFYVWAILMTAGVLYLLKPLVQ